MISYRLFLRRYWKEVGIKYEAKSKKIKYFNENSNTC